MSAFIWTFFTQPTILNPLNHFHTCTAVLKFVLRCSGEAACESECHRCCLDFLWRIPTSSSVKSPADPKVRLCLHSTYSSRAFIAKVHAAKSCCLLLFYPIDAFHLLFLLWMRWNMCGSFDYHVQHAVNKTKFPLHTFRITSCLACPLENSPHPSITFSAADSAFLYQ